MNRFLPFATAVALTAATAATIAVAQEAKMEPAVAARHAQMSLQSYHLGMLGGMAKGEIDYDAELAAAVAQNLDMVSNLNHSMMWPEGTAQGETEGSRAKAEIWSDMEGFEANWTDLQTATATLASAAGTDLESLRGAMGAVGSACGACHDDYRGPRN
jgi:cytochrome c556